MNCQANIIQGFFPPTNAVVPPTSFDCTCVGSAASTKLNSRPRHDLDLRRRQPVATVDPRVDRRCLCAVMAAGRAKNLLALVATVCYNPIQEITPLHAKVGSMPCAR
jgi:hypothetical protein